MKLFAQKIQIGSLANVLHEFLHIQGKMDLQNTRWSDVVQVEPLNADTVANILISADFLQIEDLVEDCLKFIHSNVTEVRKHKRSKSEHKKSQKADRKVRGGGFRVSKTHQNVFLVGLKKTFSAKSDKEVKCRWGCAV